MGNSFQNIVAKIAYNRPNFTALENNIANYIQDNLELTSQSTITVLSKEIGVSEASINRFCKKIGFKGFNDFKIAVVQDSYYRNIQQRKKVTMSSTFAESLSFDYIELLNVAANSLTPTTMDSVISNLAEAKNIYIIGFSQFHPTAVHFQTQLLMLSINSTVINDSTLLKLICSKSDKDDLFFIISEFGDSKELVQNLEVARQNNSPIIALTSQNTSRLLDLATEKMIVPTNLSINSSSLVSTQITYIFAVDTILGTLIKSDVSLVKEKLHNEAIFTSRDYQNTY